MHARRYSVARLAALIAPSSAARHVQTVNRTFLRRAAMDTLVIKDLPRDDELTVEEMESIKGGFFAFHATADAIDAVGKALASMAQKQ
jgi:hypothetical protein